MNIRFVGIITKHNVPRVRQVGEDLASWFKKHAIKSALDLIDPEMDLLVILGGDGTLLHVADQASYHNIPVVGINLGNLGFLTEIAADEMYIALETILDEKVRIEQRMMLKARVINGADGKKSKPLFSLNEVVIVKGNTDRVVRLRCWSDDEYITTYKADGLIVSTPTGSTAYNLSAGGPIVHAEVKAILVTPICPFMLESRPLLLSPHILVTAQLADPAVNVKILVDGRPGWDMQKQDCLVVETAKKPLLLVSSPHKDYFAILRNKLNWGGRGTGVPLPGMAERKGK